jgi:predicted dehydrogenase
LAEKKIRVGIVGNPQQSWLAAAHVPALRALAAFQITAVCTTRIESAKEGAGLLGCSLAFTDVSAMAQHPQVDLLVIAINVPSHYDALMAAFAAGKHVYCEWPLGVRRDQTRELAEAAERAGVRHMVGLQTRAAPAINRLRDLVADGYVGEVLSANLYASASELGTEVAQDRVWACDLTGSEHPLTVATGHCLDTIRYCLGGYREFFGTVATQYPEQTVIETGQKVARNVPDQIVLNGTLQSGAIVSAHIQDGTHHATPLRFEISGREGTLRVSSDARGGIQMVPLRLQGARRKDGAGLELRDIPIPESYRSAPAAVRSSPAENVAQMYVRLAKSILNGEDASPGFADALSLHHLYHLVKASSDTGLRQTPQA